VLPSVCWQRLVLEELDRSLERQDNRRNCWRFLEWDMLTSIINSSALLMGSGATAVAESPCVRQSGREVSRERSSAHAG